MAKPKPIARNVVCSECGLPWEKHTANRKTDPTPDVCIRLLKAALAARPSFAGYGQTATMGGSSIMKNPHPSGTIS